MSWLSPSFRRQTHFCLGFLLCLGLLEGSFKQWQPLFGKAYLYPISAATAGLLKLVGVPVQLDASHISAGFCTLALAQVKLQIIFECTGLFSLFILAAAIAAYPTSLAHKGWGLLLGTAAFFLYSTLRLVVLSLVVHLAPGWILLFHLYLMVLLNLGFMVFLWLSWIARIESAG